MLNLLIGLASVMDQLDLAYPSSPNGVFRSAERRADLQVSRTMRRRADLGAWQCRNVTEILSFDQID
jgi:hypothetical protein